MNTRQHGRNRITLVVVPTESSVHERLEHAHAKYVPNLCAECMYSQAPAMPNVPVARNRAVR
jgi:hypothetical protein